MDPKNAFFIASYDFPSYYDFIHKRKGIENIFLCLKTAILGPKSRKAGIQIVRAGEGFKKLLFVFFASRGQYTCALRLGFSKFALDLLNYFNYLNYLVAVGCAYHLINIKITLKVTTISGRV